ncbi:MAG: ROK family protein [Nitrospiraceae bacterium]
MKPISHESQPAPLPQEAKAKHKPIRTLVVDIGGSGIKALVVNEIGEPMTERIRESTPRGGKPGDVIRIITGLAQKAGPFERVSVGFPGIVRSGVVTGTVNLAPEWDHFHLAKALHEIFKKPVRAANDADVQGFGAISGMGVELVLTLGTGVGSSLFVDGRLVPNVEVGKNKLRGDELERIGKKRWNRRLAKVVTKLEKMFRYDRLYIGGGNAGMVDISGLGGNVTIVSNLNGLLGGINLWRDEAVPEAPKKSK